jgi:hypothetical protein
LRGEIQPITHLIAPNVAIGFASFCVGAGLVSPALNQLTPQQ